MGGLIVRGGLLQSVGRVWVRGEAIGMCQEVGVEGW